MIPKDNEEKPFSQVIVHSFFVVPFLIVVFCLLLFTAVRLLTSEQHSVYDFLDDIKTGGLTKRWQGAFELSRVLANPGLVPKEERFSSDLINAFEHAQYDDGRVRQYLALAMGRTRNPVFVKPLVDGLKNEKDENAAALIYALGMLGQKETAAALDPYLDHPQPRIRSIAAVALGNLTDPATIPALRKVLNDPEPNVRWGAAVSLARMGNADGKDVLLKMMDRGYLSRFPEVDAGEQNSLVLTAVEAAGGLKDSDLDNRLDELAQSDSNMTVRSAALRIRHGT
ncbi:MAG: HEAT repeat domain-containing protein [Candidatus Omnitrophica bacterium]|nr:HEAT repeat domain-containing protein [Candidatus Omnitrophota bacterium]